MRRTFILMTAFVMALALGACKKESTEYTSTTETTDTAASSTMATDTVATDTAMTSTTSTVVSNLSDDDKEFLNKAGMGGLAEVQMGTIETQKGANADAKAFGQRMIDDHSKANDELKQLAAQKGVTLPTELSGTHKMAYDHLASLSGAELDKAYMSHMVDDHKEDVDEFKKASEKAQDPDVKAWAAKTLPTLQDHLKQAEATQKKVK